MMKYSKIFSVAFLAMAFGVAQAQNDTAAIALENVVVTGTRTATDVRHLPMTVNVINREKLTENYRPNMLPTLTEQVPSLFTTARGMMGYGVSAVLPEASISVVSVEVQDNCWCSSTVIRNIRASMATPSATAIRR